MEFNIFSRAQQHCSPGDSGQPVRIPGGIFLNWRWGGRKVVPINVTLKRWSYIIADAIQNGGIVHLWSHPHNFIDGDQMDILLDKVLELAGNTV